MRVRAGGAISKLTKHDKFGGEEAMGHGREGTGRRCNKQKDQTRRKGRGGGHGIEGTSGALSKRKDQLFISQIWMEQV